MSKMLFAVERVMDMNERQIALSVLESLREDLIYARLNNGSRVLDVADLRQYIYEQISRIRTNTLVMHGLYGNDNGHGQGVSKSSGHNGKESTSYRKDLARANRRRPRQAIDEMNCSTGRPGQRIWTWAGISKSDALNPKTAKG